MNKLSYIPLLLLIALGSSCNKDTFDNTDFLKTGTAPADEAINFKITNDNSGLVTITPNSAGATAYDIYFGDSTTDPVRVLPGQNTTHIYKEGTYPVKVVASGITGQKTEVTKQLVVTFRAPESLTITANASLHDLTVSAKALYATGGYKVYFGDAANEVPVLIAEGASVTHTYAQAGKYQVKVEALSGGAAITAATKEVTIYNALTLPMTFEQPDVNYAWGDFGGSVTSVIPNPYPGGINTSATVGKIIKTKDQTWAGNYIVMSSPIDFTTTKKFKVKVYSWRPGLRVLLQLERNGDNSFMENTEAVTTQANTWEELTFDFSSKITDNSKKLQNILFFLDNGTQGDGSQNYTILFDDIVLTN